MKLKKTTIQSLTENRALRLKLAIALNFSEVWIDKVVRANKDNGPLTTAKAVQVITEETGLDSSEVLEEITEKVA